MSSAIRYVEVPVQERETSSAEWKVAVGGEETTAVYDRAAGESGPPVVFVCAHGAGGSISDRGTSATARSMIAHGLNVVRFNFLYKEKGSSRPDPMPRLRECITAVVARTRSELSTSTLVIGGRSMGGRAASMLAAEGFDCDGLLLLAYPLHPSGQPEKLRDAHLASIKAPVLCINGTRDALCRRELMDQALASVGPNWEMLWIDGADHSFHVPKSSGRTDSQVMEDIGTAAQSWVARKLT